MIITISSGSSNCGGSSSSISCGKSGSSDSCVNRGSGSGSDGSRTRRGH